MLFLLAVTCSDQAHGLSCWLQKQGDGSLLMMGEPDMAVLNSAGGEINSALSNPMFGVL